MAQYVLVNRRSGMFTDQAKMASRASVATVPGMLPSARVVASRSAPDPVARQVVLLDADDSQVAAMRARLPADAVLEPAVRRELHERLVPLELQPAIPLAVSVTTRRRPPSGRAARPALDVVSGWPGWPTRTMSSPRSAAIWLGRGRGVFPSPPIPECDQLATEESGFWLKSSRSCRVKRASRRHKAAILLTSGKYENDGTSPAPCGVGTTVNYHRAGEASSSR